MEKVYTLTIVYNDETDVIEFIEEAIDGYTEDTQAPIVTTIPIELSEETDQDKFKVLLMNLIFNGNGVIGIS